MSRIILTACNACFYLQTSMAHALLMSASDWMVSEERTREMYAKKAAQEEAAAALAAAETAAAAAPSTADGSEGGAGDGLSISAQAGMPASKSVAILLERLASSRRFSAGLGERCPSKSICALNYVLTLRTMFNILYVPPLFCLKSDEDGGSPFEILYTTLSSQSGAADTKHVMETFLMKRRKSVLGPPVGKVSGMVLYSCYRMS